MGGNHDLMREQMERSLIIIHLDKNMTEGVYSVIASAYYKHSPLMFVGQIKAAFSGQKKADYEG